MKNSKTLLAITFITGFFLSLYAQTNDSIQTETLQEYIEAIATNKGFSGELLVAKNNDILFREVIGLASVEHHLPLKTNAKYRIASITKTFTGTLIALAQEEGKLSYKDKAGTYIPNLSSKFETLTIHQLLTHTSGLPHNEGVEDYWTHKSKIQMTEQQTISEINKLNLLFEPGTKMHYSSLGYYLLATIIESVYIDSFKNILQQKIFDPLDMKNSGIVNTLDVLPNHASGYHLINDENLIVAPYRNYSMLKGAGDMYAPSLDLLKWNNGILSNKIMGQKCKDSMFNLLETTTKDSNDYYGYGWHIETNEPKKYYHGGGTFGYSTHTALYPESGLSIIILSNLSPLPISEIASDVEKVVFGKPFQMPLVQNKISMQDVDAKVYLGKYVADNQMTLMLLESGNNIYAQLAGRPPFRIYPKGNHQFFGKKVDITFSFDIEDDLAIGLTAEGMGKSFQFVKESE